MPAVVRLDTAENATGSARPLLQVTYSAPATSTTPATNITSLVQLTAPSGFVPLGGGLSLGTFTVTNTSSQTITGSINLSFPNLPAGVSVIATSSIAGLAPGQSAQITLEFSDTSGFNLGNLLTLFPANVLAG